MPTNRYKGGFSIYPRILDTDPKYKKISADAKLLYIKLRSMHDLSVKHKEVFSDDYGIYVVFPLTSVCDLLNCKKDKASKTLKELVTVGLIKRRRVDCGRAMRTYVTVLSEQIDECNAKNSATDNLQNQSTNDLENQTIDSLKNQIMTPDKNAPIYTDYTNNYINNPDSSTRYTDWDMNEAMILDNIAYDLLCSEYPQERIDNIVRIIVSNYCKETDYIRIAKTNIPIQQFRLAMESLDEMKIRAVIRKFDNVDTHIQNSESYYLGPAENFV